MRKSAKNEEKITRHHRSINKRQCAPAGNETKTKKESSSSGKTETHAEVSAPETPTEETEMTPEQVEKEREEFETWACLHHSIKRNQEGNYVQPAIQNLWAGWLLRASQSGWISVEERLPEDDDYVLVWSANDEGMGVFAGFYDNREGLFFTNDGEMIDCVTHWQPLPEPPKENT